MAELPVNPTERHDWLCGRLGEGKPDYWLVNLIQNTAGELAEPSVDIFGQPWPFPSLAGKYAVSGSTPLNAEAFQTILTGFPDTSHDSASLGWLLAGYAYSEAIVRKSAGTVLDFPESDLFFRRFQALSKADQAHAMSVFQRALLEQFQTRWQLHSDKTSNEWSGRGVIFNWLNLKSPSVPYAVLRGFHEVAATALIHSVFLYSSTGPTPGQTHAVLSPVRMAPESTDIVDRTVERLMAQRYLAEKAEQTAYRFTAAAALVVATDPSADAAGLKRLEALKIFADNEAMIRENLPFLERDNLGLSFGALKERARAYWAFARSLELDTRLETAASPKRTPRM